ncbi:MAG: hypothetical protein GX434_02300 [Peptococcaceae bacterium]|nr:hypothetical protein [Peptococcaceae bacterium]
MFLSWREEDVLTGFMFLGLICHGIFFAREWLIFGAMLIIYLLIRWAQRVGRSKNSKRKFGVSSKNLVGPISIFCLLIIFSLIGLLHPVRKIEGWLEAFKWLIFLLAYLWGRQLAVREEMKDIVLNRMIITALISTLLAWLPGSEMIWAPGIPEDGRFASTWGYANAAASFLGCQLLLLHKDRKIKIPYLTVFMISMISTGSRAAIALVIVFWVLLILKRIHLKLIIDFKPPKLKELGFWFSVLAIMIIMIQQTGMRYQDSVQHLLNWTQTTFSERLLYYADCLKLAQTAHFLPQAGGWLAFPFIQTIPYFTLYPHSSIFQVLLNQGLAGVILLSFWACKGIKQYIFDLRNSSDLTNICSKTAVLYLGIHSLLDVDFSFGILGVVFWLLAGINSR